MKEFNIPWLNRNVLDYYLMQAAKQEEQQDREVVNSGKGGGRSRRIVVDFLYCGMLCVHTSILNFLGCFKMPMSAPVSNFI